MATFPGTRKKLNHKLAKFTTKCNNRFAVFPIFFKSNINSEKANIKEKSKIQNNIDAVVAKNFAVSLRAVKYIIIVNESTIKVKAKQVLSIIFLSFSLIFGFAMLSISFNLDYPSERLIQIMYFFTLSLNLSAVTEAVIKQFM